MRHIYIILFFILISLQSFGQACTSCPIVCSGVGCTYTASTAVPASLSADYDLDNGERLCVTSGTFNGTVNFGDPTDGSTMSICVTGAGTQFNPVTSPDFPNPAGIDFRNAIITATIQIGAGASANITEAPSMVAANSLIINNCGTFTSSVGLSNGANGFLEINNTGTMNFGTQTLSFGSSSTGGNKICNSGTFTAGGISTSATVHITNNAGGTMTVTNISSTGSGPYSFTNNGTLNAYNINFSGGNGTMTNNSTGVITVTRNLSFSGSNGVFHNYGSVTVGGIFGASGTGTVLNTYNGSLVNTDSLSMSGTNTILNGATSCGGVKVTSNSSFTGSSGTTGTLDICDNSGVAPTRTGTNGASVPPADPKVDGSSASTFWSAGTSYCVCAVVLPIELTAFKGTCKTDKAYLSWTTASETNNDYFTIEKAVDGVTFSPIATIPGSGTSSQPNNYSYTDENAFIGFAYYRLKQTDFDGNYAYSYIVPTICSSDCISDITVVGEDDMIVFRIPAICSTNSFKNRVC